MNLSKHAVQFDRIYAGDGDMSYATETGQLISNLSHFVHADYQSMRSSKLCNDR